MELDSSSTSAGSDGKLQTFLHSGDALAQRFRRAHLDALDGVTSLCGSLAQLERLNSLPQCTSNTPATAGTASPGSSFRERTFEALVRRINDAVESVHAHLGSLRSVVGSLEKLHATVSASGFRFQRFHRAGIERKTPGLTVHLLRRRDSQLTRVAHGTRRGAQVRAGSTREHLRELHSWRHVRRRVRPYSSRSSRVSCARAHEGRWMHSLQAQWRVLRFLQAKDVQEVDDDLATAIGGL